MYFYLFIYLFMFPFSIKLFPPAAVARWVIAVILLPSLN